MAFARTAKTTLPSTDAAGLPVENNPDKDDWKASAGIFPFRAPRKYPYCTMKESGELTSMADIGQGVVICCMQVGHFSAGIACGARKHLPRRRALRGLRFPDKLAVQSAAWKC